MVASTGIRRGNARVTLLGTTDTCSSHVDPMHLLDLHTVNCIKDAPNALDSGPGL